MRAVSTKTGGYVFLETKKDGDSVGVASFSLFGTAETIFGAGASAAASYATTRREETFGKEIGCCTVYSPKDIKAFEEVSGSKFNPVNFVNELPKFVLEKFIKDAQDSWSRYKKEMKWVEMEDGTLISTVDFSDRGRYVGQLYGSSFSQYSVTPSRISIEGSSYTVYPIDCGYAASASDESKIESSEYCKYVFGSAKSTSLGGIENGIPNRPTFQPWDSKRIKDANAFGVPVFKGSLPNNGYDVIQVDSSKYDARDKESRSYNFLFIAKPDKPKPWIEISSLDLGTKSKTFNVCDHVEYDGSERLDWKIEANGAVVASRIGASKAEPITLDSVDLQKIGLGRKTVKVTVSTPSGSNSYSLGVTIMPSSILVQGKPHEVDKRPVSCALANSVVVGVGGRNSWWVTNNAADEEPAWEPYAGSFHTFSNRHKTARKWAIAWKCDIGGDDATSRSELIKQVAMGVIYE